MTEPTPQEIREQILNDVKDGTSELQINDRKIKKMPTSERLDAMKQVELDTHSPFIKTAFKKRTI